MLKIYYIHQICFHGKKKLSKVNCALNLKLFKLPMYRNVNENRKNYKKYRRLHDKVCEVDENYPATIPMQFGWVSLIYIAIFSCQSDLQSIVSIIIHNILQLVSMDSNMQLQFAMQSAILTIILLHLNPSKSNSFGKIAQTWCWHLFYEKKTLYKKKSLNDT